MRKINDSKIYLYSIIATLAAGIVLGMVFAYSRLIVEPEITRLIGSEENLAENYKTAYIKLKNPQVFARYEFFDSPAARIKTFLQRYDEKIEKNEPFEPADRKYLEILLDRRKLGADLSRNTMIFFFALSILAAAFYLFELKQNKNTA